MSNRLARASSPYLRQHAENPVDWHPWGPEAFALARELDRPVLLSVGYSACHWCHVMAHESFENAELAAQMNAGFINIKVDREERPDVDAIYMAATQALHGRGGWPMTVFLAPDGRPFYAGTYFPPEDRQGMPGFGRVLTSIANAWRDKRADLARTGEQVVAELNARATAAGAGDLIGEATLAAALDGYRQAFEPQTGGFSHAPKFPPSLGLEFLLRLQARLMGDAADDARAMAVHTLTAMARGGLYDQLGGGFHRYSTDDRWLVPHFEKMLTDNALLARLYALAYQATGHVMFEVVADETLDYVLREMTSGEGGFYAAQDADSEGVEGRFFVWSQPEIFDVTGPEVGALFCAAFDVTPGGNFDGANVLWLPKGLSEVAKQTLTTVEAVAEAISVGRRQLFEAREQRVKPAQDEKIIAGWNGLMLRAFAVGGAVLHRPDFLEAARRNATYLLGTLSPGGVLAHQAFEGTVSGDAFLADWANVADGLLALHAATLEPRWLEAALALAHGLRERFFDGETGLFFETSLAHETLIARPRELFDNAVPAGASVAAEVCLTLYRLTGDDALRTCAEGAVAAAGSLLTKHPTGFGRLLSVVDAQVAPGIEVVIVGAPDDAATEALRQAATYRYRPDVLVAGGAPEALAALAGQFPAFAGKVMLDGRPAAYVCRGAACELPTADPAELVRLLG